MLCHYIWPLQNIPIYCTTHLLSSVRNDPTTRSNNSVFCIHKCFEKFGTRRRIDWRKRLKRPRRPRDDNESRAPTTCVPKWVSQPAASTDGLRRRGGWPRLVIEPHCRASGYYKIASTDTRMTTVIQSDRRRRFTRARRRLRPGLDRSK